MPLGEELRKARLARRKTCSEVAAETRTKVQIIEDLENERFDRIAAPIYGKGFLKIYAEYLGLDPRPLIQDYLSRLSGGRPALRSGVPMRPPAPDATILSPAPAADAGQQELFVPPPDGDPKGDAGGEATLVPPKRRVDLAALATKQRNRSAALAASAVATGKLATSAVRKLGAAAGRVPGRFGAFTWTPSRIAAAALACIFILVLVISTGIRMAGCSTRPSEQSSSAASPETLIIAAEPPEPYVD
jgi:hypothetical protein